MNTEKKIEKSERIASTILRALAIVGLVAVLALAAWTLVRGISYFPSVRETMLSAVTSVTTIFKNNEEESLNFTLLTRTFSVDEPVSISWEYEGSDDAQLFTFSYHCGTEATLSMMVDDIWNDVVCGTPIQTTKENVLLIPHNDTSRFADMRLTVETGVLIDSTIVSIVNTNIEAIATENIEPIITTKPITDEPETEAPATESDPVVTAPKQPQHIAPQTSTVVVPQYSGPADLVIEIESTGVLVPVDGENVFFPISPIPSDKVAGVVFTVTNKGGASTGLWGFKATLPIEGDDEYEYLSPLQIPLASGAQMQFTLGFDEVLESNRGVIRIELLPENKKDNPNNNVDTVSISIKEV